MKDGRVARVRTPAQVLLVLIAGAAAVLPLPASLVERMYSTGVYPPVQRAPTFGRDAERGALQAAFARAQRDLGASGLARPAEPKHTWLDVYFKRAAVDGMTDPFFLETLVASDLLTIEQPFVVAHEWAHLA